MASNIKSTPKPVDPYLQHQGRDMASLYPPRKQPSAKLPDYSKTLAGKIDALIQTSAGRVTSARMGIPQAMRGGERLHSVEAQARIRDDLRHTPEGALLTSMQHAFGRMEASAAVAKVKSDPALLEKYQAALPALAAGILISLKPWPE